MDDSKSRRVQQTATGQTSHNQLDVFDKFLSSASQDVRLKYAEKHKNLLDDESSNAWDHDATKDASEAELRAATIIQSVREFERKVIFGNNASEAIPSPDTLDMGGQFLTNKTRIEERSKLFQIAKEVPKGALLHLHFNAELNPERLLVEANSMSNMYVWSKRALLTDEDLDETEMVFDVLPSTIPSNNIFDKKYKGVDDKGVESWKAEKKHAQTNPCPKRDTEEGCEICKALAQGQPGYQAYMRWSEFQREFRKKHFSRKYRQSITEKTASGNRLESEPQNVELSSAENWIKRKMVLSEVEAYDPAQTVNGYVGTKVLPHRNHY